MLTNTRTNLCFVSGILKNKEQAIISHKLQENAVDVEVDSLLNFPEGDSTRKTLGYNNSCKDNIFLSVQRI